MSPNRRQGRYFPQSQYYIERPTDRQIMQALRRKDGLVLVKGPRQIGKTSLLARVGIQLRQEGQRVVITDVEGLGVRALQSAQAFVNALAQHLKCPNRTKKCPGRFFQ